MNTDAWGRFPDLLGRERAEIVSPGVSSASGGLDLGEILSVRVMRGRKQVGRHVWYALPQAYRDWVLSFIFYRDFVVLKGRFGHWAFKWVHINQIRSEAYWACAAFDMHSSWRLTKAYDGWEVEDKSALLFKRFNIFFFFIFGFFLSFFPSFLPLFPLY
jgi:hypothetical protein